MPAAKLYIVHRTICTLDENGVRVFFVKSDEPQALGGHGKAAVKAGVASEHKPGNPSAEPEPEPEPEPKQNASE